MKGKCSRERPVLGRIRLKSPLQILLGQGVVSESVESAILFYILGISIKFFLIYTLNIHFCLEV